MLKSFQCSCAWQWCTKGWLPCSTTQWSKQREQQQMCRSLSGPIWQLLFPLEDNSHHLRCLVWVWCDVDKPVWDFGSNVTKWATEAAITLTTHCAIFAFKCLVKVRGHPTVCNKCGLSVNIIDQSWYRWNLGNSIALQLKKLKLPHLCQTFRCRSCEGIVTETQKSEIGKLAELSRNRCLEVESTCIVCLVRVRNESRNQWND